MKNDTLRVMVRDTFVVAVCLWAILYALDVFKPGFASNYVSLPRLLVVLLALALLSLALDPLTDSVEKDEVAAEPSLILFAAYAIIFIATCLGLGLSIGLTLGLAFVTLLALWAIRLEWKNS